MPETNFIELADQLSRDSAHEAYKAGRFMAVLGAMVFVAMMTTIRWPQYWILLTAFSSVSTVLMIRRYYGAIQYIKAIQDFRQDLIKADHRHREFSL